MSKIDIPRNYFDFATIGMTRVVALMQAYDNERVWNHESLYFPRAIGPEPWNAAM